jgi:hypothetical protein
LQQQCQVLFSFPGLIKNETLKTLNNCTDVLDKKGPSLQQQHSIPGTDVGEE